MQHPGVYQVLLALTDLSDAPGVRETAVQLLNSLPTHSEVLQALRAALHSPRPAEKIQALLYVRQPDGTLAAKPARLHSTLQARICNLNLHFDANINSVFLQSMSVWQTVSTLHLPPFFAGSGRLKKPVLYPSCTCLYIKQQSAVTGGQTRALQLLSPKIVAGSHHMLKNLHCPA